MVSPPKCVGVPFVSNFPLTNANYTPARRNFDIQKKIKVNITSSELSVFSSEPFKYSAHSTVYTTVY